MTTAGYYNSGKRVEEGKRYQFQVTGLVTLQDEQVYFILEDPYKIRHLLPSGYYAEYGIEVGQSIICKVDKINCTGRVYLEPNHPYYSEGQIYNFTFCAIRRKIRTKKLLLFVADVFNNEISVDCPKELVIENIENNKLDKVRCRILRIRKGKPIIKLSSEFSSDVNLLSSEIRASTT
jgi:hypothetical protein